MNCHSSIVCKEYSKKRYGTIKTTDQLIAQNIPKATVEGVTEFNISNSEFLPIPLVYSSRSSYLPEVYVVR